MLMFRQQDVVPTDAARLQGLSARPPEPGLLLGRDSAQPDEPHAEGPGARAAAAARDPVHAEPGVPLHCHDLECSHQLSSLCRHPAGWSSDPAAENNRTLCMNNEFLLMCIHLFFCISRCAQLHGHDRLLLCNKT